MKKHTVLIFLILFSFVAVMTAMSQDDMAFVDDSAFTAKMRPNARFAHDEHNDNANLECVACHHVYENGKRVEDETSEDKQCSECHMKEGKDPKIVMADVFHRRCKGCHEDRKQGPVMCSECHVK